ncbi:MAG: recN [Moraxellaceae bacterium]|jgi:DNA repair protein RecN (Recombination protein N)|nr:recN [Moraxellaceae bacterium]
MLSHLKIRDFAIVASLELDFRPGFSVITGETGAGKSILMDALGLCLGDRAESGVVRAGAERAEVSAGFDISRHETAQDWLRERELEADGECWLRRTVSRDGRSRAYINGSPATLTDVKLLGEMLIDIHSQHEHQSLLRRENHRLLLDAAAGLTGEARELAGQFQQWQKSAKELATLARAGDAQRDRLDLVSHQLDELEKLGLKPGDYEKLEQEHDALANLGSLLQNGDLALDRLSENDSDNAARCIQQALKALEGERARHPRLEEVAELLDGALIQIQEGASSLRHYLDSLDADPARLSELEERLGAVLGLARKHRVAAQDLPAVETALAEEKARLQRSQDLDALSREVVALEAKFRAAAGKLRAARGSAAMRFGSEVLARLQLLGMANSRFEVALTPLDKPAAHGLDDIEFLISANPGQPLKGLAKVASGGELSRVSLAIQVVNAKHSPVPVMVFDEVDVGIGGGIAEVVGRLLRELGEYSQVFSITHQPQVAALGHQHLRVEKQVQDGNTTSAVRELSREERIEEIARMSGGLTITAETRKHAEAMLSAT